MDETPDLHQAAGGTEKWRQLSTAFYSRVERDPRIRRLFPGTHFRCAIEELTAFLTQFFGGPGSDTQFRWWLSLRESHERFRIRQEDRAAWLENMAQALDDIQLEAPLRSALRELFERSSAYVVNSGEPVAVAADLNGPPADSIRGEIARRWEGQCGVDEAVAAVRNGEAGRAVALAESLRNGFPGNRSVFAKLLSVMMGSRDATMLTYVRERITDDPALVRERYASRTLLHEAAAQGNPEMVEFLLRLGADANGGGVHPPLYCVANECGGAGGGEVVRALVRGGANVNDNRGVKRCTALHMAARRGSVEIAEAILDCGAGIEARDSLGETALRRAVNCNKIQVAEFLVARGADAHSIGSKGLTPLLAARSVAMKEILRTKSKS